MEYYIDFFSNYNNSYIFMAMLTTFCNFSFFLLNQNNKKYPSDTLRVSMPQSPTTRSYGPILGPKEDASGGVLGEAAADVVDAGFCDPFHSVTAKLRSFAVKQAGLEEDHGRADTLSEVESGEPYSGSSSDGETSDLDYEPSFDSVTQASSEGGEESGYETSSVSISEGDSVTLCETGVPLGTQASSDRSAADAYDAEGADQDYKQSTDSEGGDSLTSSLCCPCFTNTSPKAPSGSYLGESQLSDLYSNSSFYSIDSEDEYKIKNIRLKMRSLKLKIKNIKLNALNKSNLSNATLARIQR